MKRFTKIQKGLHNKINTKYYIKQKIQKHSKRLHKVINVNTNRFLNYYSFICRHRFHESNIHWEVIP